MNTLAVLQTFCREQKRSLLTSEEKQQWTFFSGEIKRIQGHAEKFGRGVARRLLHDAKDAYGRDPSDANRAKLDELNSDWMRIDQENGFSRRHIRRVLEEYATKNLDFLPYIIRRAADAVGWLADQEEAKEKPRFVAWQLPYAPSPIVAHLRASASQLEFNAKRLENPHWTWDDLPERISGCEWIPGVLEFEGPTWTQEITEPVETTAKGKKVKTFADGPKKLEPAQI